MEIAYQVIMGVFLTSFMAATIIHMFYTIKDGGSNESRNKIDRYNMGEQSVSFNSISRLGR